MGKVDKLLKRLISKPRDFTYSELKRLLSAYGYEEVKTEGSFNVRIPPDLHIKALIKATTTGISLNHFIKKAIEKELTDKVA